ncbi:hypothetical protein [Deinococcus sp. NW-56]|uniref:hypothetical protein n=1 Tax=Deinococcus sp. NW-56 TaxID=2080419 RepID=UPI000CF38B78|nr:hypothetical protein [Deinococcus sp. NW-56]
MTQTPLSRYVDTVTAPFPPDTARRIRHELEEHALAHADALRAAGHPDPEGAAQAALGSASQVQQALMETHFTRAEEDRLLQLTIFRTAMRRDSMGQLVASALVGLLMPGWLLTQADGYVLESWLLAALWLLMHLGLLWLSWRASWRCPPRSAGVVRACLTDLFWPLAAFLMLLPGVRVHGLGFGVWPLLAVVLVLIGIMAMHGELWRLLPKALRNAR